MNEVRAKLQAQLQPETGLRDVLTLSEAELRDELGWLRRRVAYLQRVAALVDGAHDADTVRALRRRIRRIGLPK